MVNAVSHKLLYLILVLAAVLFFVLDISLGTVHIPIEEVISALMGERTSKPGWHYIIINYRIPKAITAVLVGAGLSISGLLMQTLFRNPLAGPYVLGLSSGSSLAVAFLILGSNLFMPFWNDIFLSSYGIVVASCLGSTIVLLAVLLVSQRLRDTMSILIVGLMFGSFASAFVGILSFISTAEQLQKFTFWSMGNLGNLSWNAIIILGLSVAIGLLICFVALKSLNTLLLGENYAKSLGLNYSRAKILIILATSILAGSITAFVGPIAFIGLAVPHLSKLIFQTSNHRVLFWSTILLGSILMLFCDMVSQLPGGDFTLPINAITSIVGAPVVIWLLVRKRKIMN